MLFTLPTIAALLVFFFAFALLHVDGGTIRRETNFVALARRGMGLYVRAGGPAHWLPAT